MDKDSNVKHICCVIGTRPEAIKMMPIIKVLEKTPWAKVTVLLTAQHRELVDEILSIFDIHPQIDLNVMTHNQGLSALTAKLMTKLDEVLKKTRFSALLAQGDTTTIFITALASFYHHVPFGHIEAGLRTHDPNNPFPEEMNRILASHLGTWHFAPTEQEKDNLIAEDIPAQHIYVVGNSVIDAVKLTAQKNIPLPISYDQHKRLILITSHRRENFGEPLKRICKAIRELADEFEDILFVYPRHPNPNVLSVTDQILSGHPRIKLIEPLHYEQFIALFKAAYLVMTDSGGVQEEAPILHKPVLILRDTTERPAVVDAGLAKLVGSDVNTIVEQTRYLLTHPAAYQAMIKDISPYGDGHTAERIVAILHDNLKAA